jgi:4-oxalmesaconate hydratase
VIVDVHAHFTRPPGALAAYRSDQIALSARPVPFRDEQLSDDEIMDCLNARQLPAMSAKGIDKLILSPAAYAMGHHFGNERVSRYWTSACNELIRRACALVPDRLVAACQLPQSPDVPPDRWLEELDVRVLGQGFVGCVVNPDIAGGVPPFTPSLADKWWYPLFDWLECHGIPALIHPSAIQHPGYHLNGAGYLATDHAAAFELLWASDRIFSDFPGLKLIVPHAGGAVVLQYNRMRAIFDRGGIDFDAALRRLYWDLSVYEAETIATMIEMIGTDQLLYASELCGSADVKNVRTGRLFDDNLALVEALSLPDADFERIVAGNARRIFPKGSLE